MKKLFPIALLLLSAYSFAQQQVAFTSFEEPSTGIIYTDTGDPNIAHDLINNVTEAEVDFMATATEIGFNSRYEPYVTPDVGLTDGDFVGTTDFTGDVGTYTEGTKGYQLSDVDGNMIVEFDAVDFTGFENNTVSLDYFLNATGYEGDGTINESGSDRIRIYVKDLTNTTEIDLLNTEGSDIDDLNIEGVWNSLQVTVPDNVEVQLVIEVRTNSAAEGIYIDNVSFNGTAVGGSFNLVITEIFSGQVGDDLTADWFEIENTGAVDWVSGTDPDLFYDDESADPTTADILQGITSIPAGGLAIVLVTGDPADITTFTDVWGEVISLTGVLIGYTDGAGLGGGGDTVNLWLGDPTASSPFQTASYPDTAANDGQSFDVDLGAFSTVGNANGAVETLALGGASADVPNIGSPGNGTPVLPSPTLIVTEIFSGQVGDDLTPDWFEITNTGTIAWVSGTSPDLFYDDDSADPTAADIIEGITEILPGETAIVLITADPLDITVFENVWSPVTNLFGVEIGTTDGAGLGGGGDTVSLWLGDPNASAPIEPASYPDTASNDGQSFDVDLGLFSVVGNVNGAVETIAQGGSSGTTPNIGSPGNGGNFTAISLSFTEPFVSVSEDAGSVTLSVAPSEAPGQEATVDVSVIAVGTAIQGTNFTFATTATLTFPVGVAAAQELSIPIINNADDESDVFFVVQLDNEINASLGNNTLLSVYILDDDTVVPAGDDTQLDVNYFTSYLVDASGTAEIAAHDPQTQQVFVTNGDKLEVLDFSDLSAINTLATVNVSDFGGAAIQSVAFNNGILAAAVSVDPKTDNGIVVLTDALGNNPVALEVGALPDMLTFSPDGNLLVVANEGEPNDDYTIDPEGSISVIDVSGGLGAITQTNVTNLNFNAFDSQQASLEIAGVRIFGPGASVSQDLEPEYIAVSNNSERAYVALQENNAYAVVDLVNLEIIEVRSFGLKDHSLPQNSLDTSDETDFIFDASWTVLGMYMPDAIAFYEVNGTGYMVTANEGDARDYGGYAEERKIGDSDYTLDPTVFSEAAILELETNLGDINVTIASGDTDNDGDFDEIHVFGGRSFSIFNAETGALVYDSGNDFEIITANHPVYGGIFNASNNNNSFKNRSDNKGPEPEGVIVKEINGQFYAFVLLERIGGVMVYNVTDPTAPIFLEYENNREATPGGTEGGDLGPEGVFYVAPADSPIEKGLIVVTNEVSATLSIYTIENDLLATTDFDYDAPNEFVMYPNPANDLVFFSKFGNYTLYDLSGRIVQQKENAATMSTSNLSTGIYLVKNENGISQKLIIE